MSVVSDNMQRVHWAAKGEPTAEQDLRWLAEWVRDSGQHRAVPITEQGRCDVAELKRIVEKWVP